MLAIRTHITAEDFIKEKYVSKLYPFLKNSLFSLQDLDGKTADQPEYRKDKNNKYIKNGDIKYFQSKRNCGCLMRGKVYHNVDNMWWVILNKYNVKSIGNIELFDLPDDYKLGQKIMCNNCKNISCTIYEPQEYKIGTTIFVIDERTCTFKAVATHRTYKTHFPTSSDSFKKFLINTNKQYFLSKVKASIEPDITETVSEAKKELEYMLYNSKITLDQKSKIQKVLIELSFVIDNIECTSLEELESILLDVFASDETAALIQYKFTDASEDFWNKFELLQQKLVKELEQNDLV